MGAQLDTRRGGGGGDHGAGEWYLGGPGTGGEGL